jgi:hypothetical protein
MVRPAPLPFHREHVAPLRDFMRGLKRRAPTHPKVLGLERLADRLEAIARGDRHLGGARLDARHVAALTAVIDRLQAGLVDEDGRAIARPLTGEEHLRLSRAGAIAELRYGVEAYIASLERGGASSGGT